MRDDTKPASAADWLSACRRSSERIASMLAERRTIAERVIETGTIGGGGDRTLEIDAEAETIVFDELTSLHDQGHRFNAISEERGAVEFGGAESEEPPVLVVIDPIDGSLNAKRGLAYHALAVAVADGSTMADVKFGYVYEFGTGDEWRAELGAGAFLNDRPLDPALGERRSRDGRLEVVGIESVDPRRLQGAVDALVDQAYRLRAIGALAPALCQVAAARFDGLVSLRRCRAVDVAAAQLIVREGGGHVSFPDCAERLSAPLDLEPHSQVLAARTSSSLEQLEATCRLP